MRRNTIVNFETQLWSELRTNNKYFEICHIWVKTFNLCYSLSYNLFLKVRILQYLKLKQNAERYFLKCLKWIHDSDTSFLLFNNCVENKHSCLFFCHIKLQNSVISHDLTLFRYINSFCSWFLIWFNFYKDTFNQL